MSDELVLSVLRTLRQTHDPRLPQYVAALHQPDGWSLQRIGDAMGTSREWIRVLEVRGYKQISEGNIQDLSGLPTYTKQKRRQAIAVATNLPPETAAMLTTMNEACQKWRPGRDESNMKAFNRLVQTLLNAGVPMSAIARAVGQPSRSFRRRMNRWGVIGPNEPNDWKEVAPKEDREILTTPDATCTDPSCPIRGQHAHA